MANPTITAEDARRLFTYDPGTGKLFWNERPRSDFPTNRHWRGFNTRSATKEVGTLCADGYLHFRLYRRGYLVHRVVWLIEHGEWPEQVDHIDGNRANNRLMNLREVSQLLNCRNAARRDDNKTGITGISREGRYGRWVASISGMRLGQYKTLDEAVAARMAAEKVIGYHANHGREKVEAGVITAPNIRAVLPGAARGT